MNCKLWNRRIAEILWVSILIKVFIMFIAFLHVLRLQTVLNIFEFLLGVGVNTPCSFYRLHERVKNVDLHQSVNYKKDHLSASKLFSNILN